VRVAFVGKGGTGKSSIAGTFARLLAARGEPVLAIDSDPMPGLAYSLGVELSDAGIPDEAIADAGADERPRFRLRDGLDAAAAVERYTVPGPDGLRFLQFGKLRGHAGQSLPSQTVFRQIIAELPEGRWHLVGDLAAGTRQAFFGWAAFARTVVIVVEPSAKAVLSARRLARLRSTRSRPRVLLVVNKVTDPADTARIAHLTSLQVLATVPHDPAIVTADRRGRPLIDDAPDAPAVRAIESALDRLQAEEAHA
jgi:CO dehydrogenase maturation factor